MPDWERQWLLRFGNHLNRRLEQVAMPNEVRTELQSNEIKMAALTPPSSVEPQTAAAIHEAIVASFVSSFRLMMWICCGAGAHERR